MARSTQQEEKKLSLSLGDPEQGFKQPDLSFDDGWARSDEEQEAWDKARGEEEESAKAAEEHEHKVASERLAAREESDKAQAKAAEKEQKTSTASTSTS